jgi:peptidoglycan/LPS O-acetylase OafA/YrhL
MTRYRKDIEGLRAVAVTAIVLFHFGYAGWQGGYAGVDIFFVISGFLIGRSVIGQLLDGSFSLAGFWERRIRRLYPALLAMLLVVSVAAVWLLLPLDLVLYGKSLVATALYLSNLRFLKEAGYFDQTAILKPLLHSWSLAVEEQFYIALPLVLMLLARLGAGRRAMWTVLALTAALSLAAAQLWLPGDPSATFYLFPFRAWELLAGVLVGAAGWEWLAGRPHLREAFAATGLLLIGGTLFLYRATTPFPALGAVPPVLGTALVIAAGSGGPTRVGRVLGWAPLGEIGRISYSLYLWHWPLVVFLTYYHGGAPLPAPWRIGGLLATGILSLLSFRFVEEPLRRPGRGWAAAYLAAGLASLLMVGVGLALIRGEGLPGRYSPRERLLAAAAGDFMQQRGSCVGPDNPAIPGLSFCRLGDPAAVPDFLVWGDSHGRAFRDGIDLAAAEHRRAGLLVWAGGCPPLAGVVKQESANTPAEDRRCAEQSARLLDWLATDRSLRDVLLIGRWAYYTEGDGIGADANNRLRLSSPGDPGPQAALFDRALAHTVAVLHGQGRRVFALQQVPEIPAFSARALAQRVLARREPLAAVLAEIGEVDRSAVEKRQTRADAALEWLAGTGRLTLLFTHDRFCDERRCSAWGDQGPRLFDNNHVTVTASERLRDLFAPMWR